MHRSRFGLVLIAAGCGQPQTPPVVPSPEVAVIAVAPPKSILLDRPFQTRIFPVLREMGGEIEPRVDADSAHPTAIVVRFRAIPPTDDTLSRLAPLLADNDAPLILDLENSPGISADGVGKLVGAKNLIGLRLASTRVRSDIVPVLAKLTSLEELTLADDSFVDADLASLAELRELRTLTIFSRHLTEAGLKSLLPLKRLREFRHTEGSPSIGDIGLAALSSLPQLRSLRLEGDGLTDAGYASIRGLVELQSLSVARASKLTGAGFAATESLEGLVTLTTIDLALKGDDFAPLARLADLRTLNLDTPIDDAALKHIGRLSGVRSLDLAMRDIGDGGIGALIGMRSLERLDLRATRVTDRGLESLATLPKLAELTLDETAISSVGLRAFAGNSRLVRLNLAETKVDDSVVAVLVGLNRLEYLDLRRTALTDAAIPGLSKLAGLKQLDIAKTKITKAGAAKLQEALAKTDLFYSN